jgi:hypothetical protein
MSIDRYNKISNNSSEYNNTKIRTHIPTPKEIEYKVGYITRYFIQKVNDENSSIYEVNEGVYIKFLTSSFYRGVSLDWRIKGNPVDVKKSNSASVQIASKTIPRIQLYLPNLLQFHKK